jgi:hypothetical protein
MNSNVLVYLNVRGPARALRVVEVSNTFEEKRLLEQLYIFYPLFEVNRRRIRSLYSPYVTGYKNILFDTLNSKPMQIFDYYQLHPGDCNTALPLLISQAAFCHSGTCVQRIVE